MFCNPRILDCTGTDDDGLSIFQIFQTVMSVFSFHVVGIFCLNLMRVSDYDCPSLAVRGEGFAPFKSVSSRTTVHAA